jgi:glycosyltransferase involved in cell wall biosynthesis
MRIAFVTGDAPWPSNAGGRLRDVVTFDAASAVGEVHLISFAFAQPPDRTAMPANARMHWMPWPTSVPRRVLQRAQATLHGNHVFQEHLIRAGALPIMSRALADVRPDVTILGYPLYGRFPKAARRHTPHLIVDLLELRSTDIGARMRTLRRPGERLRAGLDALVSGRIERGAARHADEVWFVTEADAQRYSVLTGAPTRVVPNTVDVARYARYRDDPRSAHSICYIGALDSAANLQAATRLIRSIFPLLQAVTPDARLTVAGRRPPAAFRRLAATASGVTLIADPPDALAVLARHGPLVAPLESGSGTKLKVLEAAAAGVPIVTTPAGISGLEFRDGADVIVATTDDEFARAVHRIWEDAELADRLRTSALRQVSERYDRRVAIDAIADSLRASS